MPKYNVGDRVVIRSDLRDGVNYGRSQLLFVRGMEKYLGEIHKIDCILIEFEGIDTWYKMKGIGYSWCDDMIEGLADDLEFLVTIHIPETDEINTRLKAGTEFLDMFKYE